MLPIKLSDWTIAVIEDLLTKGYYETESYDFKEKLPHTAEKNGKLRLRKACCSFANSSGGFLIFGVADDRSIPVEQRLVGMSASIDFPENFGSYPKNCQPSIDWTFLNPPIKLANSNLVHVVHIPRSWSGPHACREIENSAGGFIFPKRTNQGDTDMSYEEVRAGFLGYYEKKLKLQLLIGELQAIHDYATGLVPRDDMRSQQYAIADFQLQVLESVLADTYTILASYPDLVAALRQIRTVAGVLNSRIRIFTGSAMLPMTGKEELTKQHNDALALSAGHLAELSRRAIDSLKEITAS